MNKHKIYQFTFILLKNLPVGDGFAIAQPLLLQNKSNNKTMAACSSSRLHFLKFKFV
jgi:hypothetical protein